MTERWQVELFLREFKRTWPPDCLVIPRDKNNHALAAIGLTPLQRRDEILGLSVGDYVAGPEDDTDAPDQAVWVFGKRIEEHEVYIKLAMKKTEGGFVAKCISFHEAEYPLGYPLRWT